MSQNGKGPKGNVYFAEFAFTIDLYQNKRKAEPAYIPCHLCRATPSFEVVAFEWDPAAVDRDIHVFLCAAHRNNCVVVRVTAEPIQLEGELPKVAIQVMDKAFISREEACIVCGKRPSYWTSRLVVRGRNVKKESYLCGDHRLYTTVYIGTFIEA